MTRFTRKIAAGVFVFVGLMIVLVVVEHYRGKRELEAFKTELRANGGKLTVEECTPRLPPEGENAATPLLKGVSKLQDGPVVTGNLPPMMKPAGSGQAQIAWRQNELSTPSRVTNSWATLASQLDESRDALDQIRHALERPELEMALNYKQGFSLLIPHLANYKKTTHWLSGLIAETPTW